MIQHFYFNIILEIELLPYILKAKIYFFIEIILLFYVLFNNLALSNILGRVYVIQIFNLLENSLKHSTFINILNFSETI